MVRKWKGSIGGPNMDADFEKWHQVMQNEEVCEEVGRSGIITIGVGQDGTRRYTEGESRTRESKDAGCRVNSSTGTGVGTSVETMGRKSGVNRRGQKEENEGVGEGAEEGERRGRPHTLGGEGRNSH